MSAGMNTLTSIPGSMLSEMFKDNSNIKFNNEGNVFIDRDAKVFEHFINYLRCDRKILPQEVSNDLKIKIENEISHWNLYHDIGLKDYKYLALPKEVDK